MAYFRQSSFTGGEIAPQLHGRSDVDKYHSALVTCRNMVPTRYGAVKSRPAMHYIGPVQLRNTAVKSSRLVPFIYSDGAAYVLVFGNTIIDIWKDDVNVATLTTSPYLVAELPRLKFAQLGNVLTICHPNHAPYELRRNADDDWELTELSLDARAFSDFSLGAAPAMMPYGLGPTDLFRPEDDDHPALPWAWGVTAVVKTASGITFETAIQPITKLTEICYVAGAPAPWSPYTRFTAGDVVTKDHLTGARWYCQVSHGPSSDVPPPPELSSHDPEKFASEADGGGVHYWVPQPGAVNVLQIDIPERVSLGSDTPVRFVFPTNTNSSDYKVLYWRVYRALVAGSGGLGSDYSQPVANQQWGWIGDSAATGVLPAEWSDSVSYAVGDFCYHPYPAHGDVPAYPFPASTDSGVWVCTFARVEEPGPSEGGSTLAAWRRCPYYPLQMFIDTNQVPDYTVSPPSGTNPFRILDLDDDLVATENPTVVSFFEQRRVFGAPYSAATGGRPGWLFGSKLGDYGNFDKATVQTSADAYEFELASQRFEEIRSLLPVSKLIAFTSGGEWAIGGSGGALAYDNVDAKVQGPHGVSWLDPLLVDNEAVFVQERGPHVRSLVFDFGSQSWSGAELDVFSNHLLDGHSIVSWTWASSPDRVIWMVRDDGVLLSLTYQSDQKVVAWAQHDTLGTVLDVCAIPDGAVDSVYCLVVRGGTLALEKMVNWSASDVTLAPLLDYGIPSTFAYDSIIVHSVSGSININNGDEVYLDANSSIFGALEGARQYALSGPYASFVAVVDRTDGTTGTFSCGGSQSGRVSGLRMRAVASGLTTPLANGTSFAADEWHRTTTVVNSYAMDLGSDTTAYLRGIAFNGDGTSTLSTSYAYSSGTTSLAISGTHIVAGCVGFPFTQELEFLPLVAEKTEFRALFVTMPRISLEALFYGTVQLGQDLDHLQTSTAGSLSIPFDGTLALNQTLVEVRCANRWTKGALGAMRQANPYPVTILSVIREIEKEES